MSTSITKIDELKADLNALATAIKQKNYNVSGKLSVKGMVSAVNDIKINVTGSGVDLSGVTATADDVLSTVRFVDKTGTTLYGNIGIVSPEVSDNVFTVSKGFVPSNVVLEVPEMEIIKDDTQITIPVGYNKTEQTFQVGGSGIDTSDATATASQILDGATAYVNGVKITGNIKTVSANIDGNVVTVPSGYIESPQTITVGTSINAKTYTPGTTDQIISAGGYLKGNQTIKGDANLIADNIAEGITIFGIQGTHIGNTSSSDTTVKFGYYTEDGKFQEVDLSGGTPVDAGTPIDVDAVIFRTGKEYPNYAGEEDNASGYSIDFYECISYTPNFAGGFQYSMTISGASDPKANGTYVRKVWVAEPSYDWSDDPIAVWENSNGYTLKEFYYSEFNYTIYNASGNSVYYPNEPYWERVTDYNNIMWTDTDYNDVTLTFVDEAPVELPPVTEAWSGRKVVQDSETGLWSRTDTVKEGMTAPFFTPQVGMVYSEDTSIACSAVFDEAAGHLEALYHFDKDKIDTTGNTQAQFSDDCWNSTTQAKFGTGSVEVDSYINDTGYGYGITISGLPEMNAFTFEWWQYDDRNYGDGGNVLKLYETDNLPMALMPAYKIEKESKDYITGKFKHWAYVRKPNSSTVDVYLNGKKIGTVEFSAKLGGRDVFFAGVGSYTYNQYKRSYIDELAIYSVAKYTSDFTPANSPIVI